MLLIATSSIFKNASTPLSVFGKFVYIRAIIKSGRGDLVAKLPWFLNGTTSLSKYSCFNWYISNKGN